MFKNVFKKCIAFFLVLQVISALYAFFIPRLNLRSIADMAEYMEAGYQEDLTSSLVWGMGFFLFAVGSLWMFILAVGLFNEIYSKRASAFYFAMPVKRGTYFNVNMLYGIITVFTAYVIIAAVSIISVKTNTFCPPELYTFEPEQILRVLTVALLSVIVSYAVFMLFAVLSGRQWHYIALSLVVGNVVYGIFVNLMNYINNSVWGIRIPYDHSWILSPQAAFLASIEEKNILKFVIALAIWFVLCYLIGYTVFKKRKAEVAEASLAGKIVPAVVFVLYLFSVSFACLSMVNSSLYVKFGVAVGVTTVISVIVTAIFHKKAFTKKSVKCLIGTLAAVIIIALAVEFLPNIKYKNYVPAANEVESVVLDENVSMIEGNSFFSALMNTVFFGFEGNYYYGSEYPTYNFTSDESKARIEELHKKLTEQSTIDNYESADYYYHGRYSVLLTYTLKNGKTVERYYDVCSKDIYDEYIALMQTEEAVRQTQSQMFGAEDVQFIRVVDYRFDTDKSDAEDEEQYFDYSEGDYEDIPLEYTELDEYSTLLDLIAKDKLNEPRDMFYALMQGASFYVFDYDNHYRDRDEDSLDFSFSGLINGEYDDSWDETEDDYYPDYNDISIIFYTYNESVTEEMRQKFAAMTPAEIIDYENEHMWIDEAFLIDETYIYLNSETDTNTIAYLKGLGIIQ